MAISTLTVARLFISENVSRKLGSVERHEYQDQKNVDFKDIFEHRTSVIKDGARLRMCITSKILHVIDLKDMLFEIELTHYGKSSICNG